MLYVEYKTGGTQSLVVLEILIVPDGNPPGKFILYCTVQRLEELKRTRYRINYK